MSKFENARCSVWPCGVSSVGALIVVSLGLYGQNAWFYPSDQLIFFGSWLAVALGLVSTYLLYLYGDFSDERLQRQRMRKSFILLGAAVLLPLMLWFAFCLGAPAIVASALGSNDRIVTTVSEKTQRGALKRNRVSLTDYSVLFKNPLWVPDEIFNQLQEGRELSIIIRQDVLGTRIFHIEPRNHANTSFNWVRATTARAG